MAEKAIEPLLIPDAAARLAEVDACRPKRLTAGVEALLISDRDAAVLCGIGRATLHRLRAAGKWGPKAVRLGRALRFNRNECISWIEAGCPDGRTWTAIREQEARRNGAKKPCP